MSLRASGGYIGPRPTGPTSSVASGIWDLRTAEQQKRIGEWPAAPGDPYWSNVSLLLHMDGSNGSTTFADSSPATKTVTRFGNAAISTAQGKFGGASAAFDGSGDYLQIPSNAAFAFGAGDLTVEAWVFISAFNSSNARIFSTAGATSNFSFEVGSGGVLTVWDGAAVANFGSTGTIATGQWHHIAFSRSGNSLRAFRNGTQVGGTATNTRNLTNTANVQFPATANSLTTAACYIDELRVTKGIARYTANFTPPSAPFPDGP